MPITQQELADRLKKERELRNLTQQTVAEHLGLPRTSVVQMEAGGRAINSLELDALSRLYGREAQYFLAETSPQGDPLGLLLRSSTDKILDESVRDGLENCAKLCRLITDLEEALEVPSRAAPFAYAFERPKKQWEAVEQGIRLAQMERKRLNLGSLPVTNLVEIISQQGVRTAAHPFDDANVSGVFFHSVSTGLVIIVNDNHQATRRLFSYAHEYGHLLVDRDQMSNISRFSNRDDLIEIRANVFAAHFLMPEDGVHAFLNGVGHGSPTRQVHEVYDGYSESGDNKDKEIVRAQRRATPGSQEVTMLDILRLAIHFGTSYEACIYQLLNLKVITSDRKDALFQERERAEKLRQMIQKILEVPEEEVRPEARGSLRQTILNLIINARLQNRISGAKAREYMQQIDANPDGLEALGLD